MKTIPYSCQAINEQDIEAVSKALKDSFLTQGPAVLEFEKSLAKYTGAKYALVLNSGTAALHTAYFALGLKSGDEFITTPMTFTATANAGLYLGAKPIFVDIDPQTGNLNLDLIEENITEKTKLIAPVYYAGQPIDLAKLKKIANKYNLKIVADACHALGANYRDKKVGGDNFSDITILSFHPVKHITTGEGGALLTNDKNIYQTALMFRTHGITKDENFFVKKEKQGSWYHEMQDLGFNYRMPDILAALGSSQLKRVNQFIEKRRHIAQTYDQKFKNNPYFETISETKNTRHVYHLYPILLKKKFLKHKQEIFENLKKRGLGVQVHYIPTHLHPYYQKLGYKKNLCPQAENFYNREISIPIHQLMTNEDIDFVVKNLFQTFEEFPMKVGAVIQCRANSSRLPNKIFKKLPFDGKKTVLEQVISRVKQANLIQTVIVATTKNKKDDLAVKIANQSQVEVFRGSEKNVLERYYQAALEYELDVIVRITADCPCLDPILLDALIKQHLEEDNDITTNTLVRSFPRGLDIEIIEFAALENAHHHALTDFQKEHVTQYFYNQKLSKFKIKSVEAKGIIKAPEIRITLDNSEDYAFLCAIFENLSPNNEKFSTKDILNLLIKKPWLKLINQKIALEEITLTAAQKKEKLKLKK